MSKIYEIHPGWMSKSEIAYKLGVSERTIYARWKRGELLRKETQGQVLWAELPAEGRKESEETLSSVRAHEHAEGFGRGGRLSSALEEERRFLSELIDNLERKTQTIIKLERENTELRMSLEKAEEKTFLVERENENINRQNKVLLRALEQRTLFQVFVRWVKDLWK